MDRRLEMYNLLNEINPYFKKTKYPYNYWTPEKIVETKKDIKLIWSKNKEFLIDIKKKNKIKGGMSSYIYVL